MLTAMPKVLIVRRGDPSRWQGRAVTDLVAAFNREVGNHGSGRTRLAYLSSLHAALLASGLECSSFLDEASMALSSELVRDGDRLLRIVSQP